MGCGGGFLVVAAMCFTFLSVGLACVSNSNHLFGNDFFWTGMWAYCQSLEMLYGGEPRDLEDTFFCYRSVESKGVNSCRGTVLVGIMFGLTTTVFLILHLAGCVDVINRTPVYAATVALALLKCLMFLMFLAFVLVMKFHYNDYEKRLKELIEQFGSDSSKVEVLAPYFNPKVVNVPGTNLHRMSLKWQWTLYLVIATAASSPFAAICLLIAYFKCRDASLDRSSVKPIPSRGTPNISKVDRGSSEQPPPSKPTPMVTETSNKNPRTYGDS